MSFNSSAYAFEPNDSIHTGAKDIGIKKKQALQWYEDNIANNKSLLYAPQKQAEWLKQKALKWHEDYITNQKFYFVHANTELNFTKNKALRWHENNSTDANANKPLP